MYISAGTNAYIHVTSPTPGARLFYQTMPIMSEEWNLSRMMYVLTWTGGPSPMASHDVGYCGEYRGDGGFPHIFVTHFNMEWWDGVRFLIHAARGYSNCQASVPTAQPPRP